MGLLDDLEFLKKRKPNLLADVRQLQGPSEPYLRQQYPEIYGGLGGLLGMAPDEMAGSVLDPNTARVRSGAQIGFPVGTAAQVAPLAPMLAPAVKAGAKALGPTAVRMGEGYLQSKGLMPQLDVYHGSPYKFDRFDASKIGSGEGAQAYGYGIYTAENPGVSIGYQKALSNRPDASRNLYYKGKEVGGLAKSWKEQDINDFAIRALQDVPSGMGSDQKAIAVAQQVRKVFPDAPLSWEDQVTEAARLIDANTGEILKGNLYKVDLPDEQIAKMLDWDKPLSEQSAEVQKVFGVTANGKVKLPNGEVADASRLRGESAYRAFAESMSGDVSAASAKLRELGIPGIKYLDEGSRQPGVASMTQAQLDTRINILKKDIDSGLGDQERMKQILSALEAERASHPKLTRNFVTFPGEEQSLTILERNGQPMIARTQQQDATPDLLQYQQMLDDEERRKSAGLLFR